MKNIMFIAPPAAGKGTQADLVSAKYAIPHISTGDILREKAKEDSEIGNYVKETQASGQLVKDDITLQLLKERLAKDDCKNGFVIEGFPRSLDQAYEYDKVLKKLGYDIGKIIYINIDKKTLEKRITGRRVCEDCNATYNINDKDNSPEVESVCDNCGGKLYQRSDDNLESFNTRFQMYTEKTEPIIDHYRKQNVLVEVDGDDTFENIFKKIDKIINE